jgi:hypothetical protein
MNTIPKIRRHDEIDSTILNLLIDRINKLSDAIPMLDKLRIDILNENKNNRVQITDFITRYGKTIEETPDLINLARSLIDYKQINVFIGNMQEVSNRPISHKQVVFQTTPPAIFVDEELIDGTQIRHQYYPGENTSTFPLIAINGDNEWTIDGITTGVKAQSEAAVGPTGPQGPRGFTPTIKGITNLSQAIDASHPLFGTIFYLDTSGNMYVPEINSIGAYTGLYVLAGNVRGPQGPIGPQGPVGATGVSNFIHTWYNNKAGTAGMSNTYQEHHTHLGVLINSNPNKSLFLNSPDITWLRIGNPGAHSHHKERTAYILTTDWVDLKCIVAIAEIEPDSVVWVSPSPQSYLGYTNSQVRATNISEGFIEFECTILPTSNLTIEVVVGGFYANTD